MSNDFGFGFPLSAGTNTAIFWWAPFSSYSEDALGQLLPTDAANLRVREDNESRQIQSSISNQQVRTKRAIRFRWKRARTNKHEIRKCSMHTFEKCLVMMQEVMQNSSLAFPTNVDDLETTCK